jgi:hypothetical protein
MAVLQERLRVAHDPRSRSGSADVRDFLDSVDRVAAGGTVIHAEVVRQIVGLRHADGPLAGPT